MQSVTNYNPIGSYFLQLVTFNPNEDKKCEDFQRKRHQNDGFFILLQTKRKEYEKNNKHEIASPFLDNRARRQDCHPLASCLLLLGKTEGTEERRKKARGKGGIPPFKKNIDKFVQEKKVLYFCIRSSIY